MSGEGGGASIYFGKMEPEQTRLVAAALSAGDVFFDIGANVGYYSILASRIVGDKGFVASFEPLPRNLVFLTRHRQLNHARNIEIYPAAISDKSGTATFHEGSDPAMGGLSARGGREFEVTTLSLDDAFRKIGRAPTVIKIDVEGGELAVIAGGEKTLRDCKPTLFLSTHSEALSRACLEKLHSLGYDCRPITNRFDEYYCVAAP
jgi:FkbM family methyltransferase